MDEHDLAADIERAVAGDGDALQRLIVHFHAMLRGVVAAARDADLHSRIDPDDVLQQAYVSAFQGLAQCRFAGPAPFYKWLETIALSRLEDFQRAERRKKRDAARAACPVADSTSSYPDLIYRLAGPDSTPSRLVAKGEAVAAVLSCLARLNDEQREVVRLRYLEGQPVADIAAHLGKSESAIHMLCHRGLKALRERMVSISQFLTRV
jgi:RNA polymerase sigma-70 factor, ECF subfamily